MGWYMGRVRVWINEGEAPGGPDNALPGGPPSWGGYPDNTLPGGGPPSWGGGWGGGNYPSQGLPGFPGRPDQGLPPGYGGRPDQGLPGFPARPDQGLPGYGHPDQGLPGFPGRPDQGLPPWYGGGPDQGLPPYAQPKAYDPGDEPTGDPAPGGEWVVAIYNDEAKWVYVEPDETAEPKPGTDPSAPVQ